MASSPLFDQLRRSAPLLTAGMLTADLMSLGSDMAILEAAGVSLVHFDVMDGCFCPMMTVGPPVVKAIKTRLYKDAHLMILEPLDKVESYVAAGADLITFHVESCIHPHRVLQALGKMKNANDPERGLLRGIALNPGTPLETIAPLIDDLEMIFLLAVNPGWGGQKFIPSTAARLAKVRDMIGASGREILLGVDGGITRENVEEVVRMGPDIIVTGSAVFDGKAPLDNARFMMQAMKRK